MSVLDSLQVFHGEANPARARIYARLDRPAGGERWRLEGRVTGPQNALAATLPATLPLRDLGPGPTLLAEAVLPDPCFWSPASPARYEVEAALINERGEVQQRVVRQLGIRALGARRASFYLEGKRWVLRGVDRRCVAMGARLLSRASIEAWREAWASLVAVSPEDELCDEASRLGVLTAAWITGGRQEVESELRRLARWPAVAVALIQCRDPLDDSISAAAPNVLLGEFVRADHPFPSPWAQVTFAEEDEPKRFAERFLQSQRPVVAMRRLEEATNLDDARTACDRLQRDLAPHGDYAGYVIHVDASLRESEKSESRRESTT